MVLVAKCESGLMQYLPEGGVVTGRITDGDKGVLQVNTLVHLKSAQAMGLDVETLRGNLVYSRHLYNSEGKKPWNSSKHCWSAVAVR